MYFQVLPPRKGKKRLGLHKITQKPFRKAVGISHAVKKKSRREPGTCAFTLMLIKKDNDKDIQGGIYHS